MKTAFVTPGALDASDAASAAVAKTPNRVSLAQIEANIAAEFSFRATDVDAVHSAETIRRPIWDTLGLLTLHIVVLKNGFSVVGKSAPADALNFNVELGRKFAREDAIRQVWPLMGYALREKMLNPEGLVHLTEHDCLCSLCDEAR